MQRAVSAGALVCLGAIALFAALPAVAATAPSSRGPLVVRNGFTPHPFTTSLDIKNDGVSMYDRGFAKCGSSETTKDAAFVFTLDEDMSDLRLTVSAPGVLVGPDGAYACLRGNPMELSSWPKGRWQVFLTSSTTRLQADVRLDQPVRSAAEAASQAATVPALTLPTATTPNPAFVDVDVGVRYDHGGAGVSCAKSGYDKDHEVLAPLGRFTVKKKTRLRFDTDGAGLVLVDDQGRCRDTDDHGVDVAPGAYGLWARWKSAPPSTLTSLELEVEDLSLAQRYPEAPQRVSLGDGRAPQLFTTTSGGPARGPQTMCEHTPRVPSFVFDAAADNVIVEAFRDDPDEDVSFDVLVLDEDAVVSAEGAGGDRGTDDDVHRARGARSVALRCDVDGPLTFRKMHGRYAVFVKTKTPSTKVQLITRRADVTTDLFWAPIAIPDHLPLVERGLERHYPLLATVRRSTTRTGERIEENLERFFLQAPLSLFVTTSVTGGGLVAGEPLLVRGSIGEQTATVARSDGKRFDVPVKDLVDLALPTTLPPPAPPTPAADVEAAQYAAGDAEAAYVAAYDVVARAFDVCVGTWMEKNDPTWGKSYELVYANGDTMSDRKFRQADGVCGRAKVDAAGKKLIAQVNASRKKSAAAYRAALTKRFAR